jgi:hypothetical protein
MPKTKPTKKKTKLTVKQKIARNGKKRVIQAVPDAKVLEPKRHKKK